MSEFNVGDKVKTVSKGGFDSVAVGDEGEVLEVYHTGGADVNIFNIPNNSLYFCSNEIKKVDNMSDFKSFYVNVDGPNHSRILQEIAFEEGFTWNSDDLGLIDHLDKNELSFECGDSIFYNPHSGVTELEDPTLKEFRQALRGEYDWEDPIVVQGYEVSFDDDEGFVEVGCEQYHYEDIKALYNGISKAKLGLYPSFNIKIEHDTEGEIPLEVVEAIYNRISE
jgi:hypothetical protein